MRLTIVQRGRIRDPLVVAARDDYSRRFRRYGELTIVERPEKETASLFPAGRGFKVLLDERGETPTSEELARSLERWTMAHGAIAFAIGDAYGHNAATLAAADQRLALSRLTLQHTHAHLLLVEQLYRAAAILRGDPYHHA